MTKTDEPNLDEETRKAVAALAHRVRQRDAADIRQDPEIFALEFMTAMRGRGWRPTPARRIPQWQTDRKHGVDPATHADEIAAVKARCAEVSKKHKEIT